MSRRNKWIKAAVILLCAGALICLISMAVFGFDFGNLSTGKFVTKTFDIDDDFKNISIKADVENISFVPSEDKNCKVVCYEDEKDPHNVRVEGDTLKIEKENNKWHLNLGITLESQEITVYLPEDTYGALSIDSDTGKVEIPGDFSFDSISADLDTGDVACLADASDSIFIKTDTGYIKVSDLSANDLTLESDTGRMDIFDVNISQDFNISEITGRISMENVSCRNLASKADTGSLTMTNVIAEEQFNLESDTGNIELNGCDADTIYIRTDTGSVTGTLLTEKVFITESDTGSINVPKTISGGRCEISTDTGNIRIEIKN